MGVAGGVEIQKRGLDDGRGALAWRHVELLAGAAAGLLGEPRAGRAVCAHWWLTELAVARGKARTNWSLDGRPPASCHAQSSCG